MSDDPPPESPGTPEPAKRHRRISPLILSAVAASVGLSLLAREFSRPAATNVTAAPIATIQVAPARSGDIGVYVDALGTVTPLSTVNIYSQVTGVVTAVHYTEGQMIKSGEPLIDVDTRPFEAQLQEAQGTLEHDQGLLAQAQIDLKRYREASVNQSIARQQLEDQEQTVAQYSGTVKNDLGQMKYAQVQLSYCRITAPVSGRVGLRLVDRGNTIFAGSTTPLLVITQLQPITVVFNVAEDNLDQVREQVLNPVALSVEALNRTQQKVLATGHLVAFDNQVDTTTGTVRFRAEFDNRDMSLFPNQFVNARLLVKNLENVVLVPSAAVQRNGTQAFVYVQNGDIVRSRPVKEIAAEGNSSAVEGVAGGELVAVTGFDKLDDGTRVIVQAPPTGATAAHPTVAPRALL